MAAETGFHEWTRFKIKAQAWLGGREVGTGDNLQANITQDIPAVGGGVRTGSGFFPQTTLASPKAPLGATAYSTFSWLFSPQLDEESALHVNRFIFGAGLGRTLLWHSWGTQDMWLIHTALRTKWSLPHLISGGAPVTATSLRGLYVEPIVQVMSTSIVGLVESTLTFTAGVPGSTEFSVISIDDDQDHIITGDLTASAGKILSIWYWPILEVNVLGATQGLVKPGEWGQGMEFELAPDARRSYQDD